MIVLVLLGICVFSIVLYFIAENFMPDAFEFLFATLGWTSGIIVCVMLIISLISYPISLSTISDMENFQEINNKVFLKAIVKFPDATTVKTSNDTTQTVRLSWDYTKEVLAYNKDLRWYRKYQDNWFLGIFISTIPKNLKFIKIE